MDGLALINGESGTLKTCDMASFESHVRSEFEKAGHTVSIIRTDQTGMEDALEQARASQAELLIAAGGDGMFLHLRSSPGDLTECWVCCLAAR